MLKVLLTKRRQNSDHIVQKCVKNVVMRLQGKVTLQCIQILISVHVGSMWQLGLQHYHFTHITCITPSAIFFTNSILHILHTLPAVLVFKLGVWHYHITHITCITPSANFFTKSILHILHALPTLLIFSLNVNITHITHITCITCCACF